MYLGLKRTLDIVLCLLCLVVFWWLFVIISLLILIEDRGNVLFTQRRIGKDKEEFLIYKFRTMKMNTPKDMPTHLLENPEMYITKIGKILRKTSLDELPQLFNIIRGDMSIVGPRPALYNQYDLIAIRDEYRANDVAPGLTGWAQINGRDEISIDKKAKLDGEYIEKMGLFFDVKIIFMTIGAVFNAKGVKEGVSNEDIDNRK